MFIAMNRFRIRKGFEAEFEGIWATRQSNLPSMEGFIEFHLLKGPETDDSVLYASHVVWQSRQNFEAWTQSEAFRASHRNARGGREMYLGPPQFEGFEVVRHEAAQ